MRICHEELSELSKDEQVEKNRYIKEFEEFIGKISTILKQTSIYQIDCIT